MSVEINRFWQRNTPIVVGLVTHLWSREKEEEEIVERCRTSIFNFYLIKKRDYLRSEKKKQRRKKKDEEEKIDKHKSTSILS